MFRTPQRVAAVLERDQLRLYTLIWQRTVATQMADARFDQVGVDIEALAPAGVGGSEQTRYGLRATGQTLMFDGFLKLYREGRDDEPDEDAEAALPELTAEQTPPHARGPAGAALHPAAAALHGGVARQEARGARDRPAVHLRVDHLDDPGPRVRAAGGSSGSGPKTSATS